MRAWKEEEVIYLAENWLKLNDEELARKLNRTVDAIQKKRQSLGLYRDRHKYSVNEDYFCKWSNPMAYILGFTMADGSVSDDYKIDFELKWDDREVLYYIRNQTCPNRPIRELFKYVRNFGKTYHTCRLSFRSKKMVHDLAGLNIVPRKTGKEELPFIPEEYRADYLRGLVDGDGCWYIDRNRLCLSISSGCFEFLNDVNKVLCNYFGSVRKTSCCYELRIRQQKNVMQTAKYMYTNACFSLQRKLDKVLSSRLGKELSI